MKPSKTTGPDIRNLLEDALSEQLSNFASEWLSEENIRELQTTLALEDIYLQLSFYGAPVTGDKPYLFGSAPPEGYNDDINIMVGHSNTGFFGRVSMWYLLTEVLKSLELHYTFGEKLVPERIGDSFQAYMDNALEAMRSAEQLQHQIDQFKINLKAQILEVETANGAKPTK